MTSPQIIRIEHRVPGTQTWRPGGASHEEIGTDVEEYHRPLEQAHGTALHGSGVGQGFAVSATVGSATVRVGPGIAVDSLGRHVVLAAGGVAEVAPDPDQVSRPVDVTADGVSLSTLGHTGPCLVTVRWRETFNRQLLDDSFQQTFQTRHTPWLELVAPDADPGDGVRVVLATLDLDAASGVKPAGVTTAGRHGPAPAVGAVVLTGPAQSTSAGVVTVADAPTGRLLTRADGQVRLAASAPGASVEVGADGGTLAGISLAADSVSVRRADGSAPVVVDGVNARLGIGTSDPTHPVHVAATSGLRQNRMYLSGTTGWSSLTYNAVHNEANTAWEFPDPSRPAVTVEMDDAGGTPRFQVWSTPSSNTQAWKLRLAVDGNSGAVSVPNNLLVGNGADLQGVVRVHNQGPDTLTAENAGGNAFCASSTNGFAIRAISSNGTSLWAAGPAQFVGDVNITGELRAGSKQFVIDHPLDPENRYLAHAGIESDERVVVYTGNATCDDEGRARVMLADWVEALATDFRYQLTCVGAYAPVFVAEPVHDGAFVVGGGSPGLVVSWQLTGVRQDAWARANDLVVEEDKPETERGHYQHPEAFGKTLAASVHYARNPDLIEQHPHTVKRFIRDAADREASRAQEQSRRRDEARRRDQA